MISQKAKYALRALISLARAAPGESRMIGEISREQAIPKKFLEQILLELKRAELVTSRRGRMGGYILLKAPEDITYGAVLRLIDGPIAPLPCLSKIAYRRCADCQDEASCEIRHVFERVTLATRAVLDRTSLADSLNLEDLPIDEPA
ncbi:RrF2 family transcriptional regulator [Devosia honganensis]|uniref:RrF2 family transcriptional regulator n=1 Tax=Devosia honganensis TaxID=1610527 RepID=A0ABV7WYT0_9HYPH